MRKSFAFASAIVVAIALTLIGQSGAGTLHAQQHPVKSYQIWTHIESSDGTPADVYVARRSDGATVRKTLGSGVTYLELVTTGLTIQYSDRNSNITTFGNGKARLPFDFKAVCTDAVGGDRVPGESRNILGFDTIQVIDTTKFNEGDYSRTSSWIAPELNCEALLQETTQHLDDKVYRTETVTAMKVSLGDAPDDVFAVPKGVEVPPSEFRAALGRSRVGCGPDRLDRRYYGDKAAREGR